MVSDILVGVGVWGFGSWLRVWWHWLLAVHLSAGLLRSRWRRSLSCRRSLIWNHTETLSPPSTFSSFPVSPQSVYTLAHTHKVDVRCCGGLGSAESTEEAGPGEFCEKNADASLFFWFFYLRRYRRLVSFSMETKSAGESAWKHFLYNTCTQHHWTVCPTRLCFIPPPLFPLKVRQQADVWSSCVSETSHSPEEELLLQRGEEEKKRKVPFSCPTNT